MQRIFRSRLVIIGSLIIFCLCLLAFLGPLLAPNDPLEIDLQERLKSFSPDYPLGTDHLGRCVLSRLLHGSKITLGTSMAVAFSIITVGLIIGLISGLAGGWLDSLIMRLVDIILAFPTLVLVLAVIGILGPSLRGVMIGAGMAWWAIYARLIRGLVLSAKEKEFVKAGKVVGTRGLRLVARYIMPQVAPPVLVLASLEMGTLIMILSGLSFLGIGVQAPIPEWGAMLNEARHFMQTAPHFMLAPGFAIFIAVLGFNLLGEGLRDVFHIREMSRW